MWVGLACLALVAYAVWFFAVVRRETTSGTVFGSRRLASFISGLLYNFGRWYLKFTINTEEAVKEGLFDREKQYLLVWHPHGAFTIAAMYFFAHFAAKSTIFPRNKMFCAVADLLLSIPLLAEYLLLCNARSIRSSCIKRLLAQGCTVGLQPGGIHEQVHTDHQKEVVYFPARLGFIRLAIEQGVPILPIYAFGENQLYDTSDWLRNINIWMYDRFKVGNLFVHGRCGGLPVSPVIPNPLLLPMPGRNMHLRWGEPVEVGPKDENPSPEKIQEVFQKYCASLQNIFDKHKDECLPKEVAEKGLTIVLREENKKEHNKENKKEHNKKA